MLGAIHTGDSWGYDRQMFIETIRQADAYLTLTEFEKTYLLQKGIEPGKIHVVGAGVDVEFFEGEKRPFHM
ncbi:MAG: glycosyltransferase [Chloroflexi bacterium]|nr:glycosyltransferase [Chloroflexota bacterium]